MSRMMMKRILPVLLAAFLCLSLCACVSDRYVYGEDGHKVKLSEADAIQEKYTRDECRAEAERLFGMPLEFVRSEKDANGVDCTRYVFATDSLPFELSVYSGRVARIERTTGDDPVSYTVLYAHAYCDYYERMMEYKQEQADALAAKHGLKVERLGQSCIVSVSSFEQMEDVYEYLSETNEMYDFEVIESEMVNILRDIRNRPTLTVFYVSEGKGAEDDRPLTEREKIITLYYTINHSRYNYTKDALLGAMREQYIETIDRLGMRDDAVTEEVREFYVKPALTQLCINGEPVRKKECDGFTLDPNIVFDYNWLMDGYYGDVRLCAPAADYDLPPGSIGDDRNFKYLVELLGGRYESEYEDEISYDYCSATWWLGGNEYGAGSIMQSYIPTMSAFSKNGAGISVNHAYSKNMWGLENGYGAEDYFLRITPNALGTLLGVEAVADYEKGTLDLVTPEGYFDFEPPAPPEQYEERFLTERVPSENGLAYTSTHYIIYNADGSVLTEGTTIEFTYAECKQLTHSIVMMRIYGGAVDSLTFFDTDHGTSTEVYENAGLIAYPYILYSPGYKGEVAVKNVVSGGEYVLVDDAYRNTAKCWKSFVVSPDGSEISLTYYRSRENDSVMMDEVTTTMELVLPE